MNFSDALLNWFKQHGRKNLPWQENPTAYRVWISEIMLQQTQVATVIPYYERFMQSFPDVLSLANANLDHVLEHWSGLGYYARARNLHKAAQVIRDQHQGVFPDDFDSVVALPGIGRSTAGAVLAFSTGQRHAILDGNVKRVLARYCAIEGWPGQAKIADKLWEQAEALTPSQDIQAYTQAIMDLGATVCTRSRPTCGFCPVKEGCIAYETNTVDQYPASKPKKTLPVKTTGMLMLVNEQSEILLERRPPVGIWGGLLGFPEFPEDADPAIWAKEQLGDIEVLETWNTMRHTFSHFHLDITPVKAKLSQPTQQIMEAEPWVWYNVQASSGGLAAPVKKLINQLLEI